MNRKCVFGTSPKRVVFWIFPDVWRWKSKDLICCKRANLRRTSNKAHERLQNIETQSPSRLFANIQWYSESLCCVVQHERTPEIITLYYDLVTERTSTVHNTHLYHIFLLCIPFMGQLLSMNSQCSCQREIWVELFTLIPGRGVNAKLCSNHFYVS